ncbi:MAG: hypothetical protein ACPGNV_00770 [Mangrovicoccus sp.]
MRHSIQLTGVSLPAESAILRDAVVPEEIRPADYFDDYDRHTLIYDVAEAPAGRGIVVTCPPLFNLAPIFQKAVLKGRAHKRHKLRTSEHYILKHRLSDLPINWDGQPGQSLRPRPDLSAEFADQNALLLMNKDNQLDWIADWARFYAKIHGATAVVAFDNGSTSYSTGELASCLESIAGFESVAVFSAPFPFGPKVKRYKRQSSMFLQNAMMNMARLTILSKARAVLNVDPDEIVVPKGDITVFDAAVKRRHRFVKIAGQWVYPAPGSHWPCRQAEHHYRLSPISTCHDKWCAVPSGFMSRFGWDWHKVADEASRPFKPDPRFEMLHCRATTTGWKRARNASSEKKLVLDPELRSHMPGWFG